MRCSTAGLGVERDRPRSLSASARRSSLERMGEVHTLIVHGAAECRLDAAWSVRKSKRATFNRSGASLGALRQRLALRAWIAAIVSEQPWDVIVASYVGLALLVPLRDWTRLLLDADDFVKKAPGGAGAPIAVRAKVWLRNAVARFAVRWARHVWFSNPVDFERLKSARASFLGNVVAHPALNRSPPVQAERVRDWCEAQRLSR